MMERFETTSYDVLVIGAGGAGLRAAIAAPDAGRACGVVCKSLLGKAHTVMAEGGIAGALATWTRTTTGRSTSWTRCAAAQFLNNWRTVEIFAKEAPERVLELEQWGAVFDRTPEGLIMQRPFGGHTYRRLSHVGDRTGLELIRTLQDRAVHQRHDVLYGSHHDAAAEGRRPRGRRVRLLPRDRAASSSSRPRR